MDTALKEVPKSKVSETPVYLMATAGVRLLEPMKQKELLASICDYLQKNTGFQLPDCNAHVQVIPGETEGLYGWIAANYLLGGFDNPEKHPHGKEHHTYGFLDMGGASAQIAFAPNSTESKTHWDDLKIVRLRDLDGTPLEYKVFTSTWLGYGANQARDRYVEELLKAYDGDGVDMPDPCLPVGLRVTTTGDILKDNDKSDKKVLIGTGKFDECMSKTFPLLGKDKPCADAPCLLNGQHAPAIDFDINHFVGVSEYWHTTHGVFGKEDVAYNLAKYQKTVKEFCTREWSSIAGDIRSRKTDDEKLDEARQACFKASWLINMLHQGIGIPQDPQEHLLKPGADVSKDIIEDLKEQGLLNPFKPVDKIDDVEVSWTLGKMVLYAAGQIPPRGNESPVGFGSNSKLDDFEHAGSTPLKLVVGGDDDDDDDAHEVKPAKSSALGLIFFIIIIAAVAYWLRKPERRRKLFANIRRRRKPEAGRRGVRTASFFNRIVGRNTPTYERVLEEGDAPEFELGGMDSDENDHSDGTESSPPGRRSGITTPKFAIGSTEDLRPPPSMDRNGLVLRTESREHLAPNVQMLNAGRRSRTGSPTRRASPLTAVM